MPKNNSKDTKKAKGESTDLGKRIKDNCQAYTGTLYTIKHKKTPPWNPSGREGRYSGEGTKAYYFGNKPETAWREVRHHDPDIRWQDCAIWGVNIQNALFVDAWALEGTRSLMPKEDGGYEPTQELSSKLIERNILGVRYPSSPAYAEDASGTCFCIYQHILNLTKVDFFQVNWGPDTQKRKGKKGERR